MFHINQVFENNYINKGGLFDLQKYEMQIKLIIKSNHSCIVKLIPNN